MTARRTARVFAFFVVTVGVGCARSQQATTSAAPAAPRSTTVPTIAPWNLPCPMTTAGVTSTVSDVNGGVAITFLAPPDRLDGVREAVWQMAEGHSDTLASCPCRGGNVGMFMVGGGPQDPSMTHERQMPAADARAEDVVDGIRLTLLANDDTDVDALRAHVRMHVDQVKTASCPTT